VPKKKRRNRRAGGNIAPAVVRATDNGVAAQLQQVAHALGNANFTQVVETGGLPPPSGVVPAAFEASTAVAEPSVSLAAPPAPVTAEVLLDRARGRESEFHEPGESWDLPASQIDADIAEAKRFREWQAAEPERIRRQERIAAKWRATEKRAAATERNRAARERAETLGSSARALEGQRNDVKARLATLGLSAGVVPADEHQAVSEPLLEEAQYTTAAASVDAEKARLRSIANALRSASWRLDYHDQPAIRDGLRALEQLLTAPVVDRVAIGAAVESISYEITLAHEHAVVEAHYDELRELATAQSAKRVVPVKKMKEFATKQGLGEDEITVKRLQKTYTRAADRRKRPAAPPDGTMNLDAFNGVTSGETAGQRYWPRTDMVWRGYHYHVSLAFQNTAHDRVRITRVHVTFRDPEGEEPFTRYWWTQSRGELHEARPFRSGPAPVAGMQDKAEELVDRAAAHFPFDKLFEDA
jgi:hypothetical protein